MDRAKVSLEEIDKTSHHELTHVVGVVHVAYSVFTCDPGASCALWPS